MPLSPYGEIIEEAINRISEHYDNVVIDRYCIMPDHIHMLIFINPDENGRGPSAPALSAVVGSMKRWVSRQIGFPVWQKSFFEHLIRDDKDLYDTRKYIVNNPKKLLSELEYN